jgi:integrase
MKRKRGQNEGSIFKRKDGRWCGILNLGWENGRRKRKHFYGASAADVQEQLLKARADHSHGLPVAPERQRLGHYLERWLEYTAKVSTRPRTHGRYTELLRLHVIPALGHVLLEKLAPVDVQRLLNRKLAEGLSPKTVRHIRGVLSTALGRAVKWSLIGRNAAALTDAPRAVTANIRAFDSDEARRFIDAVSGERLEALYLLTITLGLRRGEVLALKWNDLDLDADIVHVRASLQRVNGCLQLSETKTQKSRRKLPILEFVAKALRLHRTRQIEARLLAGPQWRDAGFVFTTGIGTPVDPANLLDNFKRILKKAGLPDIRFHDLRHSAASLLLTLNVHPRVVMELLGHSQISLTMNTYSHVVPDLLREAVGKLGVTLK